MGNFFSNIDNDSDNEKKKKKIAKAMFGLCWECPNCFSINEHYFPSNIKGAPNIDKHMVGSTQHCNKCFSEYILE